MSSPKFAFVYGTLRPHEGWGKNGRNYVAATHRLPGWVMFDTGPFPYIVPGDGEVHGNLLPVDEEIMKGYDRYEGAPSFYSREIVNVLDVKGEKVQAYVYMGKDVASRGGTQLHSGDWTEARSV